MRHLRKIKAALANLQKWKKKTFAKLKHGQKL
jgi:hypothetical protein